MFYALCVAHTVSFKSVYVKSLRTTFKTFFYYEAVGDQWMAGFDREQRLAWRTKNPDDDKQLEFSEQFYAKDGAKPTDCMYAKFADGAELALANFLVADHEKLLPIWNQGRKRKAAASTPPVWQSADEKYKIVAKQDHKLLYMLKKGSEKLVYIVAEGREAIALEVGKALARDYDAGTVTKENIKRVKDELLKKDIKTTIKTKSKGASHLR